MKTQINEGRARQLISDAPTGPITVQEGLQWLFKAVIFLLARYINED